MRRRTESNFCTEWSNTHDSGQMDDASMMSRHLFETELANQLNAKPDLNFQHLVVRRLPGNSICLEGTLTVEGDEFDVEDYVKCLIGADSVVNRLMIQRSANQSETTVSETSDILAD